MALVPAHFDADMRDSRNAILLQESERIMQEYVRRGSEMPKDYYSLLYPANLFMQASRNHVFFNYYKVKGAWIRRLNMFWKLVAGQAGG